ncbi:MAG: class I SAM-dependent methyltransferase [Ignavibacteriae bacterium]|nr:class I SAM-dependent methyltransferase [Ignavibacteriota bacterium]
MANAELIENKKSVPFEFNNVAKNYDLATFLSQGYQKDLQLSASRMNLNGNEYIADLCCGTGKSTEACLNVLPNGKILGIDNSKEMLEVANKKFQNKNVTFSQADVMELDYPDETFDAIFMAYGIRNMPDINKCLQNLERMLKPGGVICFHEYSLNDNLFSKIYWKFLGYFVIIPISSLLSGSSEIYKYLVKSVLGFPSPNKFVELLEKVGFQKSKRLPMPSWRRPILHTFIAYK